MCKINGVFGVFRAIFKVFTGVKALIVKIYKYVIKSGVFLVFCNKFDELGKNSWKLFTLGRCEFREDEIDIANLFADRFVAGTEAQTRKIFIAEFANGGFEAVITAGGAALAIAKFAKVEVKIIANDQEVRNIRLVEVNYRANATPDVVIKSLWLYKKQIVFVVASDLGEKFSFALPVDLGEFGVKI